MPRSVQELADFNLHAIAIRQRPVVELGICVNAGSIIEVDFARGGRGVRGNECCLLVIMIFGHRADAAEKSAELGGIQLVLGGEVKGDARAPVSAHRVNNLNVRHPLLPIPAQVVVVDMEISLARVPVAGAIRNVSDERIGSDDSGRRFQLRECVEEWNDAGIDIRLGGDGATHRTLTIGRQGDESQKIGLAGHKTRDAGTGNISNIDRIRQALGSQAVENAIAGHTGSGTRRPRQTDGVGESRSDGVQAGWRQHNDDCRRDGQTIEAFRLVRIDGNAVGEQPVAAKYIGRHRCPVYTRRDIRGREQQAGSIRRAQPYEGQV